MAMRRSDSNPALPEACEPDNDANAVQPVAISLDDESSDAGGATAAQPPVFDSSSRRTGAAKEREVRDIVRAPRNWEDVFAGLVRRRIEKIGEMESEQKQPDENGESRRPPISWKTCSPEIFEELTGTTAEHFLRLFTQIKTFRAQKYLNEQPAHDLASTPPSSDDLDLKTVSSLPVSKQLEQLFSVLIRIKSNVGSFTSTRGFRFQSNRESKDVFEIWLRSCGFYRKSQGDLLLWMPSSFLLDPVPSGFRNFLTRIPRIVLLVDTFDVVVEEPPHPVMAVISKQPPRPRRFVIGVCPLTFRLVYASHVCATRPFTSTDVLNKVAIWGSPKLRSSGGGLILGRKGFNRSALARDLNLNVVNVDELTQRVPPYEVTEERALQDDETVRRVELVLDRAKARLRRFRMLDTDVPLDIRHLLPHIFQLCAMMAALEGPLLTESDLN